MRYQFALAIFMILAAGFVAAVEEQKIFLIEFYAKGETLSFRQINVAEKEPLAFHKYQGPIYSAKLIDENGSSLHTTQFIVPKMIDGKSVESGALFKASVPYTPLVKNIVIYNTTGGKVMSIDPEKAKAVEEAVPEKEVVKEKHAEEKVAEAGHKEAEKAGAHEAETAAKLPEVLMMVGKVFVGWLIFIAFISVLGKLFGKKKASST